jgi:hypothetical protein
MEMELNVLTTTCRHLRAERDEPMYRLRKQKHAAHATCYRLRVKLRKLELSNRLILASFIASERINQALMETITKIVTTELETEI